MSAFQAMVGVLVDVVRAVDERDRALSFRGLLSRYLELVKLAFGFLPSFAQARHHLMNPESRRVGQSWAEWAPSWRRQGSSQNAMVWSPPQLPQVIRWDPG